MKYGLVGNGISQSPSPFIHSFYGNDEYEIFDCDEKGFEDLMIGRDFLGINITKPYKKAAMEYLDRISPDAERIGSVNTVINEDGAFIGFNTDYFGLKELMEGAGIELFEKRVMILGCGGAAATAQILAMDENALSIHMLKRDGSGFDEDAQIIINATPVGSYPGIFEHIDISRCRSAEAVVDMVYSPIRTDLCTWAMSKGLKYAGGLYMLCCQASYSHEIFRDEKVSREKVADCYGALLARDENIVLTGMPSCGKTTYGKQLADTLGRPFYDTDTEVEKAAGKSVREIFESDGEEAFRALEKKAVKDLSMKKGAVISTGGGVVLDSENMLNLRKNGRIYFIDKPLTMLEPSDTRPLADDYMKLEQLYNLRYGIYLDACDVEIRAEGNDEQTVYSIGTEFNEHILFEESSYI